MYTKHSAFAHVYLCHYNPAVCELSPTKWYITILLFVSYHCLNSTLKYCCVWAITV